MGDQFRYPQHWTLTMGNLFFQPIELKHLIHDLIKKYKFTNVHAIVIYFYYQSHDFQTQHILYLQHLILVSFVLPL